MKIIKLSAILLMTILMASVFSFTPSYSQTSSDGRMIKIVSIVTLVDPDRTVPKQKPGVYSYIFEACAGSQAIVAPEAIISSDSESKKIKLAKNLAANECQLSVSKIKASTKDKITSSLIERGGMSKLIGEFGNKIDKIKSDLETQKTILKQLDPKSSDYKSKTNETTNKIVDLRKNLNDARQEYYRLLYLLHT